MNRYLLRAVAPLLAGMAFLMVATALQFSLLAVRAAAEGFGDWVVPAMSTSYFAGFLLGGWLAPRWIDSVGHVRTFSALASLASVIILVQVMAVEPPLWVAARVLSGLCIAGMITSVEAWLNAATDVSNRGVTLSLYMLVMYLGFGGGQMVVSLGDADGFALFAIASILLSLCLVPVLLGASEGQVIQMRSGLSVGALFERAPVGLAASFSGGLAWGVIASMLIVLGLREGFNPAESASLVVAAIVGAVLVQLPVGRLSDRIDRRVVILALGLLTAAAGALSVPMVTSGRLWILWVVTALFGALALPGYSLGIAHVGDVLEPQEAVAAAGTLVTVSSLGSAVGPPLAWVMLAVVGSAGIPLLFAVAGAALGAFSFWRLTKVPAKRPRGHFVPLGVRSTAIGTTVVAEEIVGSEEQITFDEGSELVD